MEFEAVDDGTVGRLMVAEGTEGVKVNTPIAVLLAEGEDASAIESGGAEASFETGSPQGDASADAAKDDGEPVVGPSEEEEPAKGYGRNPHAGADHGRESSNGRDAAPAAPSRRRPGLRAERPTGPRRRGAHLRLPLSPAASRRTAGWTSPPSRAPAPTAAS